MNEVKSTEYRVPTVLSENELEKTSSRFHIIAAWVAAIFDPVFAITDYLNIPDGWTSLLSIRISVSAITVLTILVRRKFVFPSYVVAFVPFVLISFQNAYTYKFLDSNGLLGQNLNYMALLVGAAMFVLWHWRYSVLVVVISGVATFLFIYANPNLSVSEFFLKGGLLLLVTAIFMIVLIHTRYDLTLKEIRARLELKASNEEIQKQAAEIKRINENLEQIVHKRTQSLEVKNKALEEYAFINAHKLRSPVASILGLVNILTKMNLGSEEQVIKTHLEESAKKLDEVVGDITKAIERGDQ